MTKGTNDDEIPKPTFVKPPGITLSRKTIVICGLIVAVALVILLAWTCNAVSQEGRDEDHQTLYDIGYTYPIGSKPQNCRYGWQNRARMLQDRPDPRRMPTTHNRHGKAGPRHPDD